MTNERQAKIARYRKRIERERQATLTKAYIETTEKLAAATEALANFRMEAAVVNVTNEVDNTELVEAIKGISITAPEVKPVIKVDMPHQTAPVVNVTMPDVDMYAKYKRYNSQNDAEGTYHAFLDGSGNWFIQLESTMNGGKTDITRYAVGKGEIGKAWSGRKRLSYKPIDKVEIA